MERTPHSPAYGGTLICGRQTRRGLVLLGWDQTRTKDTDPTCSASTKSKSLTNSARTFFMVLRSSVLGFNVPNEEVATETGAWRPSVFLR